MDVLKRDETLTLRPWKMFVLKSKYTDVHLCGIIFIPDYEF